MDIAFDMIKKPSPSQVVPQPHEYKVSLDMGACNAYLCKVKTEWKMDTECSGVHLLLGSIPVSRVTVTSTYINNSTECVNTATMHIKT